MGTFGGHALPGSFFIAFGLWWTVQIFRRYYQSLILGGRPFKSSVTFACSCLCGKLRKWEVEGFIKIVFTIVGFTLEIITGFHNGYFVYLGNGQHATMFFFFGLSGVVDIMVHHRLPIPKDLGYVTFILALLVEGLLFKFHLYDRPALDVLIHTFLLYTVFANALALMLEMKFQDSVIAALSRAYFILLQGTWFWQLGFILYNPVARAKAWDMTNHDQMMIATMMFTWHMAAVFIVMLVIGSVIGCSYRYQQEFMAHHEYDSLSMKLLKRRANGQTDINIPVEDSESEVEFEKK